MYRNLAWPNNLGLLQQLMGGSPLSFRMLLLIGGSVFTVLIEKTSVAVNGLAMLIG